jgi:putative endopeptidase
MRHSPPRFVYKKPGNGFYHYVNQKWLKTTDLPNSLSEYGASEEIEHRNKVKLFALLKRLGHKEIKHPQTSQDNLRMFSHVWFNSTWSKEETYVKSLIQKIWACRSPEDMASQLGWFSRIQLSPLTIETEVEEKEPFYLRMIISPSALMIPKKYYLNKSLEKDLVWIAYNQFIYTCASELGLPHLFKAVEVESDIATIFQIKSDDLKEYEGSDLEHFCPDFHWSNFMAGAGIRGWRQDKWLIEDPNIVKRILRWICTTSMEKLAGILTLNILNLAAPFLRPAIKDANFRLFEHALRGVITPVSKKDQFLDTIGSVLPEALCMEFSKVKGNTEEKLKDVQQLISNIKDAAIHVMQNNNSLTKHTTALTIEKIRRMKVSVGSPDQELPRAEFHDSLVETMVSLRQARSLHEFKKVNKPVNHKKVAYPCHIVNASYYESLNHIIIPWGILDDPFYLDSGSKKAQMGWNYGGIGATIAHEITHAFDLEGSHYNPSAKYKEWWTKKDRNHFKARTRKIGKFFTKFEHYGVHLDGKKTLSENWADFGGLIISLDALKKEMDHMKLSEDKRMEAIRTFFTAYAVSWRDLIRKENVLYSIEKSVHSLAEDRVDRIVPHFQDWYDAFDVKEHDALFLPVKDRLKFF